ncbi:hypothetical protein EZV62_001350 [Acer yangbiense]|uniref:Uncharacterized protein n=1 Tax=Acer yangbiense TaxID=1000413 RepID=A0A5C7IU04_9ROSI|nr:hypothetical protein EZV62_001350 [Acer yangbiense]
MRRQPQNLFTSTRCEATRDGLVRNKKRRATVTVSSSPTPSSTQVLLHPPLFSSPKLLHLSSPPSSPVLLHPPLFSSPKLLHLSSPPSSPGVFRMKEHLAGVHGNAAPCTRVTPEVRDEIKTYLEKNDRAKKSPYKQATSGWAEMQEKGGIFGGRGSQGKQEKQEFDRH